MRLGIPPGALGPGEALAAPRQGRLDDRRRQGPLRLDVSSDGVGLGSTPSWPARCASGEYTARLWLSPDLARKLAADGGLGLWQTVDCLIEASP